MIWYLLGLGAAGVVLAVLWRRSPSDPPGVVELRERRDLHEINTAALTLELRRRKWKGKHPADSTPVYRGLTVRRLTVKRRDA